MFACKGRLYFLEVYLTVHVLNLPGWDCLCPSSSLSWPCSLQRNLWEDVNHQDFIVKDSRQHVQCMKFSLFPVILCNSSMEIWIKPECSNPNIYRSIYIYPFYIYSLHIFSCGLFLCFLFCQFIIKILKCYIKAIWVPNTWADVGVLTSLDHHSHI